MRMQARKPASYEDLAALPEGLLGQIVDGELVATPRPTWGHAYASSALGGKLTNPFQFGAGGPGGWLLIDEPELHLGADILVPDLAGWRRERMPKPPAPSEPFVSIGPDWVCEILSPSTVKLDRIRKMPIYAREQVRHAWLIDPANRSLEVYRREPSGLWLQLGVWSGDQRVHAEPFEAVELELSALWLEEEPSPGGQPSP